MNHRKALRQYKPGTPERAALETVTSERASKGPFAHGIERKMLKDSEVREKEDHHAVVLTADIKALKGLSLTYEQIRAANRYDAALGGLEGWNHEVRDFVDKSRGTNYEPSSGGDMVDLDLIAGHFDSEDTGMKLLAGLMVRVFITHRELSIKALCSNTRQQVEMSARIRLMLDEMAKAFKLK